MTDPAAIRTRLAALSADAGGADTSQTARELRHRAITAAATAYSAAHGHPTEAAARGRTRWAVSRRAATAAVLGLALLAGIVALRTLPREPVVTVELDPLPGAVEAVGEQEAGVAPVGEIAAWRNGLLFVNDVTIDSVVARLQRYHPAWISVPDRTLGHQRVTGLYDLRDPDRTLKALVQPYGGKVRSVSGYTRIVSRY